MRKLLVVQPYVPEYRSEFFARLRDTLSERGIAMTLAASSSLSGHRSRHDDAGVADIRTRSRAVRLGARKVRWQRSWPYLRDYDGVVLEASGALVDTSVALLKAARVGLWGHVDGFVASSHRVDLVVERWQLRHAGVVMPYTQRGADKAIELGVEPCRVVPLHNTFDTSGIAGAISNMGHETACSMLGLTPETGTTVFGFIGGLDESKRLGFLAETLDRLHLWRPDVRLVVAGRGADEHLLHDAVNRGQVHLIGRAGDAEKAALAHIARGILMPGRVGLVAVDSFALGLPIVTTDWPWHAPEFEYLTPGHDSMVTADSVDDYVAGVIRAVDDPIEWDVIRANALAQADRLRLDDMVDNFVTGVELLLRGA